MFAAACVAWRCVRGGAEAGCAGGSTETRAQSPLSEAPHLLCVCAVAGEGGQAGSVQMSTHFNVHNPEIATRKQTVLVIAGMY